MCGLAKCLEKEGIANKIDVELQGLFPFTIHSLSLLRLNFILSINAFAKAYGLSLNLCFADMNSAKNGSHTRIEW